METLKCEKCGGTKLYDSSWTQIYHKLVIGCRDCGHLQITDEPYE